MSSQKKIPVPKRKYDEITLAVLGNVDSGKSTTVGVLTNPEFKYGADISPECLDDGNGKSRSRILHHDHEKSTGRTSSITHNYMAMEGNDEKKKSRMINFVDLAGHEKYLKTTIRGVVSSFPDYAIVCVGKNITTITKEHIGILINMHIPFVVVFTKIDVIPAHVLKNNIKALKILFRKFSKKFFKITKPQNTFMLNSPAIVPFIKMSNKTGEGINLLCEVIQNIEKKETRLKDIFLVDHIYNVPGFGTVVSGMCGFPIEKNTELQLGPFQKNEFIKVKVRTIHNDYRTFVDRLESNVRGCLCIKIPAEYKNALRAGLVLVSKTKTPNTIKNFRAELMIFHHSTTMSPGYTAYTNCHSIREMVKFNKLYKNKKETNIIRSGEMAIADLEFLKNYNYMEVGSKFLFREGKTMGIGRVVEVC